MIIYFSFNSFSNIFINEIGIRDFNIRDKFNENIKSFRNYKTWFNLQENKDLINLKYEDVLKFNLDKNTIVINQLNKLEKNSAISNEILNYVEHTTLHINYTFNHLAKLNALKKEINSISAACDRMLNIYLTPNISKLINDELLQFEGMKDSIKECLENRYNNNDILEIEYQSLMNELFVIDHENLNMQNIDSLDKAIQIYDINYEDIYVNNIKAFNIYIFTAILLLLTLTLQYGIILFLLKKD